MVRLFGAGPARPRGALRARRLFPRGWRSHSAPAKRHKRTGQHGRQSGESGNESVTGHAQFLWPFYGTSCPCPEDRKRMEKDDRGVRWVSGEAARAQPPQGSGRREVRQCLGSQGLGVPASPVSAVRSAGCDSHSPDFWSEGLHSDERFRLNKYFSTLPKQLMKHKNVFTRDCSRLYANTEPFRAGQESLNRILHSKARFASWMNREPMGHVVLASTARAATLTSRSWPFSSRQ